MVDSTFGRGFLSANADSLRTQVALWDDMKLWKLLWKKMRNSVHDGSLIREELHDKVEDLKEFDESELRVMLLTRLASHCDLELPTELTVDHLNDLSERIEKETLSLLRENDDNFDGETITELAQHVMQGLFADLSDRFEDQDDETRNEIVNTILEEIETMPEKQRERLRQALDADELSQESIRQAIVSGSLGSAFAAVVHVAGFSAYMVAVKALAAATGLIGITLPFAAYTTLTSAMAMLANPLVLIPALLGGGYFLTRHTNKKMRNNLLPVIVTQSVVSAAVDNFDQESVEQFLTRYNTVVDDYVSAREQGEYDAYSPIEDQYNGISTTYA